MILDLLFHLIVWYVLCEITTILAISFLNIIAYEICDNDYRTAFMP
jgi:hypothetical protein